MEILFISHKYPPAVGGMEKQSFELISGAEKGNKVHKLVFTGLNESKVWFFWRLKSRLKKILAENPSIELIHLNDGLMGLFCLWLEAYSKIPVVLTFHGLDLVFHNSLYQRVIRTKYTKSFSAVICVSQATADGAIERGFDPEKVFVISNGVDHELAKIPSNRDKLRTLMQKKYGVNIDEKRIITSLGRPVKRKGFSWFIEKVIPSLEDDVLFVLAGPRKKVVSNKWWESLLPKKVKDKIELSNGGVNDEIRILTLLKNPNTKSKVLQTGYMKHKDVMSLLGEAELFVMPNIKMEGDAEGFGLVALEASLRQTVVLAANLEGIPQAIQNGKNGFLLPSKNAEMWATKITDLLSNKKQLKEHATKFREFTLNNYSWEKMAIEHLEVFEKITKKEKTLVEI